MDGRAAGVLCLDKFPSGKKQTRQDMVDCRTTISPDRNLHFFKNFQEEKVNFYQEGVLENILAMIAECGSIIPKKDTSTMHLSETDLDGSPGRSQKNRRYRMKTLFSTRIETSSNLLQNVCIIFHR